VSLKFPPKRIKLDLVTDQQPKISNLFGIENTIDSFPKDELHGSWVYTLPLLLVSSVS
jgi:hypothetical protein